MIEIPTKCPSCGSILETVNEQLFCRNEACPAQSFKKLQHFAKTMKIKGLGEKSLEKLGFEDISDIYASDISKYIDILGNKVGRKVYQEVETSKQAGLELLLAAFSIQYIGETAAKKIASVVKDIAEITESKCKEAGLGPKATESLISWVKLKEYDNLPVNTRSLSNTQANLSNKGIVCITGKLDNFKNRDEAKQYLESFGYCCVDSVTKNTNFLIDEEGRPSSKREKAEKLGIQILTIQELIEKGN